MKKMTNEIYENHNEEVVLEKPSLFGMIMNPKEQFERIRENPKIIVALILVTVITTIGLLLMVNGTDFADENELVGLSEEEIMMVTLIGHIAFVAVGVFTPVIAILISSIIYIIVAKVTHSDVSFKQLFSMNTYVFIISAISFVINGFAFLAVGNSNPDLLFTSLNSIINAEGPLGALLNNIEVFTIWGLVITALG